MSKKKNLSDTEIKESLVEYFNTISVEKSEKVEFKIYINTWKEDDDTSSITLEVHQNDCYVHPILVGCDYTDIGAKRKVSNVIKAIKGIEIKESLGINSRIHSIITCRKIAEQMFDRPDDSVDKSTKKIVRDFLNESGYSEITIVNGDFYAVKNNKFYEFKIHDSGHAILIDRRESGEDRWRLIKRIKTGRQMNIIYLS